MTRTAISGLVAIALSALSLTGCSSVSKQDFTVVQAPPTLTEIDFGAKQDANAPARHGDMTAMEAQLSRDGKVVGELSGILTTIDIPEANGVGHESSEERVGTLLFTLGEGDTIVVSGSRFNPVGAQEIAPDDDQTRAVVGGTGAYAGASGEVTTVRNSDGSYSHRFVLTKPR